MEDAIFQSQLYHDAVDVNPHCSICDRIIYDEVEFGGDGIECGEIYCDDCFNMDCAVNNIKNLPSKIYLQIGEDCYCKDWDEIYKNHEITWCVDKIFDNDIEFELIIK